MQKQKRLSARILSMALTVAMICTMLPATAFAQEIITPKLSYSTESPDNIMPLSSEYAVWGYETENFYASIKAAMDADDYKLSLNEDLTESATITPTQSLSINLNGYKLTNGGSNAFFDLTTASVHINGQVMGGGNASGIDINGQDLYTAGDANTIEFILGTSANPITISNSQNSGGKIGAIDINQVNGIPSYVKIASNATLEIDADKSMTVGFKANLINEGTITNLGTFTLQGGCTLSNTGTLNNGDNTSGTLNIQNAAITGTVSNNHSNSVINVTGGTIAGLDNNNKSGKIVVTGGTIQSITNSGGSGTGTVVNSSDAALELYTVTVGNPTTVNNTWVSKLSFTEALGYDYGCGGVITDSNGKIYVWAPAAKTAASAVASSKTYSGTITNNAATLIEVSPTVSVATQTGTLTYGDTGSATFTVATSNFATAPTTSDYTLAWFSDAGGTTSTTAPALTVTKTDATTLTIAPGTANVGTYYFKLTATKGSETATSGVVTVTIGKADATAAMKAVATSVSKDGKTGATVTLPTKQAGATYGTPTAGGTITMTNMSITGDTLTYTAPASTAGQTGTITIPVTTATNYNDYSIIVTITSTNKTPITVTGVTVATKTYNGIPAVKSGNPVYTLVGGAAVNDYTGTWDYLYTSADAGSYSAATAPTNAGAYKLTVTANDTKYSGTQEILFTISKATITITADNKSAYVGDAKPALTYTATGLASGDTLATVPTLAYESEPDMSKAGTVKIKASGAAVPNTDNYESAIAYADGTLTISNKSSGGDGGGGGGSSSSGNTGSSVTVDGKTESIGKVETSGSTTTVVVDSAKLDSKVSAAKDGSSVVVPVSTTKDSAAARLVMESVEKMAAKDMTLEVKSGKTTYALPAAAIDTGSVLAQIGATDASKVPFTVTITNGKNIKVEGATVVGTPMSFTVTATYNGKSVTVDSFDSMVARTMEITKEQAGKVTTAVVVDADGTVRHVPTSVYEQGGKWYARINSMTNSTYALITNESKFTDVSGKWYEATASELSAREVTDGVFGTAFEGEKNITRAEFAGLLVNAFGLPKNGKADFSDVAADAWYSEAVATASEYGIANGIGGGKFAPDATITRQEAMVMIQRAASVVSYTGGGTDNGTFTDRAEVGAWAAEGVAFNLANGLVVGSDGKISPKATITRAETATVLLRLLQKAELIDVRTEV